eukprot:jgi/Picre1/34516/NNA_001984.t1
MTSALNTLLSGKRKRTHNKTTDDDLYQRIGVDIIQQLLDKNTKTSWKKLDGWHKDLAVAVAEEHKDLLKETDLEIDDDDHGDVTQRDGDESAHDTDDDDVVALHDDGELDDHSSLRDQDFFGNHLDMSVESLEPESVSKTEGIFFSSESSQCWSKVGASLEVSKDGACPKQSRSPWKTIAYGVGWLLVGNRSTRSRRATGRNDLEILNRESRRCFLAS